MYGYKTNPEPLAKRVADILKEQNIRTIEKVDHMLFDAAIWVVMKTDDHPTLTECHDSLDKYPIYEHVKNFLSQ